jgi:hypothetical protein
MEKRAKAMGPLSEHHGITNLLWRTRDTNVRYPLNVRGRGQPLYHNHNWTRALLKETVEPYEFEGSGENPDQSVTQLQTLMLLATLWRSHRIIEQSTLEQLVTEEWEEEDDDSEGSPLGDLYAAAPSAPSMRQDAPEGEIVESPTSPESPNDDLEDFDDDDDEDFDEELAREEELNWQENLDAMNARLNNFRATPQDTMQIQDSSARGGTSEGSSLNTDKEASGQVRDDTTPPIRSSSRLAEKRRASEYLEGDPKRRKSQDWKAQG